MRLVIDVPEKDYKSIVDGYVKHELIMTNEVIKSIANGVVLPYRHGRLIDADALLEHSDGGDWNGVCLDPEYVKLRYIYNAPTIIEPYKKESENEDSN